MAGYIPPGANAVETSDIRTSGDVTVTDTQPGTVNNGEFLTNSGGSLTGGTIQTTPNVPPYEEDSNSPFEFSNDSSHTVSLSDNYDLWWIHVKVTPESFDNLDLRIVSMNGNSFDQNADYYDMTGSLSSGNNKVPIGTTDASTTVVRTGEFKVHPSPNENDDIQISDLPLFDDRTLDQDLATYASVVVRDDLQSFTIESSYNFSMAVIAAGINLSSLPTSL